MSHFSQVLKYTNTAALPATGNPSILYLAQDTKLLYEWDGAAYQAIQTDTEGWSGTVATYADLPAAASHNGEVWLVTTSSGIWPLNKPAGLWISNGSAWTNAPMTAGALFNSDIGVIVQAYSARLTDIAALSAAANNIIVGNGSTWVAESGATARTSLGLGTGDSPAFTGLNLSALTASQVVVTDGSKNLSSLAYASANTVSALVQRDGSGNFAAGTITASLTGTASGNTTYTPSQYGVVTSGAANAMSVIAPDASTAKVLVSGGASANPGWALLTNSNLSGTAGITNANLANSSVTIGSTAISLGATSTTLAGLTSVTSTTFVGALTGNASTATTAAAWTTARNLAGNSVNGSADVAFANKFIVQGTADAGLSGAQFLGALATGIVKNTTTTGVLSIAVAGDFPTLNQNTTGSAATLTTPRTIGGVSFNGSADITVASATGGFTVSGGNLAVGANDITCTGSLGSTGSRLTKGWFTDLQVTNAIAASITGSAPTLTTARAIYGNNFDGSAALTQIIASTYGGTGNGFTKFSGATTSEKTYTLPDANATILYSGGPLGTPSSGTLTSCTGLPISTGVSGLGTGVATALGIALGSAGAVAGLATTQTFAGTNTFSANVNMSQNYNPGFTSIVSSGATTTLTVNSPRVIQVTGSASDQIKLPDVTTLSLGFTYEFYNLSSGTLDIRNTASTLLRQMAANTKLVIICESLTVQTSWHYSYQLLNSGGLITNSPLSTPSSGDLSNCTFPTLNQNTTGSAASLSISGQTGLLSFTGLASTSRIKTVRDAADTILELGGSYTPTGTWHFSGTYAQIDVLRLTENSGAGGNYLAIAAPSTLSANRTLTITTGDASRGITLNGSPTLNDWFDQSVKTTSNIVGGSFRADGTVSAPGLSFDGDTNTGLFSNGTDTIGFTTGGTNRISLSTSSMTISSTIDTTFNSTTTSTASTNGAIISKGGIGVAKDSFFGGDLTVENGGDMRVGTSSIGTTATTGFLYIPSVGANPTGVPAKGNFAMVYQWATNKIFVYNGAWKSTAALT